MKLLKLLRIIMILLITALVIYACSLVSPSTPPRPHLRFAYLLWPGFFPATIAQAQGFFQAEGVDVEAVLAENIEEQMSGLSTGKYDGIAIAMGTMANIGPKNHDTRIVLVVDESVGADAIVAQKAVSSVNDLKGKIIGTSLGGFGELFVHKMLDRYYLTAKDVTLINVSAEKIPEMLQKRAIDMGHTWEPYVSEIAQTGAKIIFTSKDTPGLITDVVVFNGNVLRDRPNDIRAFIRAWFQAVDYWQKFPEEGNAIIAKTLNIPVEKTSLTGVKLMNLSDNLTTFTPGNTTKSIYHTLQLYFDFYFPTQRSSDRYTVGRFLDPSFLK